MRLVTVRPNRRWADLCPDQELMSRALERYEDDLSWSDWFAAVRGEWLALVLTAGGLLVLTLCL